MEAHQRRTHNPHAPSPSLTPQTIKDSTEPVDDLVRQATAELNRLHSSGAAQRESRVTHSH